MTQILTTASGLLSLLEEDQVELQVYALNSLNLSIDHVWAEVSEFIPKIEILYENEDFSERQLAALVASKVYYHLGEFEDSLNFALGAGELFDPSDRTEYVQTIIAKAIDRYISQNSESLEVDPRLIGVVERMFERCFEDEEYKQAIGIAFESNRLDIIEKAILSGETNHLLDYVLKISLTYTHNLQFHQQVVSLLIDLYNRQSNPDHLAIAQCNVHLNRVEACGQHLASIINNNNSDEKVHESKIIAMQICFDLQQSASQNFLSNLIAYFDNDSSNNPAYAPHEATWVNAVEVLSGMRTIRFNLEFLAVNNNTDPAILRNTKSCLDSRNSLPHSALTFSNALMSCGTTSDKFLRSNMEWLSRASNWSKFSATAAFGVIHKGNLANAHTVLAPYLPGSSSNSSPYSEGGSLFALGLIFANHYTSENTLLMDTMKSTQNEVLQHGAALGLGATAMATNDEEVYRELKNILFTDSAVAGEAAGLAMGLVKMSTIDNAAIEEMFRYAQETQHEKIIRGLAIGIALMVHGHESNADEVIKTLSEATDPILRYGGMYAIGMAYCGTGSNKAIKYLLHIAVSDVNDDVRRAAVTSLGFILFKTPKQVPRVVQLLSESYNPHVRYGATLALGIACASTGLQEAIDILEPIVQKDSVDYVRQGALIALGMILCQHNDKLNENTTSIRKLFESTIANKHEDAVAKFGAAIAQGLIDAGGRNSTITLSNPMGLTNMPAVAGLVLFTQFWYWFPLTHFVSMAFSPTAFIGVTSDFKIPDFKFISKAKPSLYAYPPKLKSAATTGPVEKIATAVLSTSAKSKQRAKKKNREQSTLSALNTDAIEHSTDAMEMDEPQPTLSQEPVVKAKETEPEFKELTNMQRVLPQQLQHLEFPVDGRFFPVKPNKANGIVMLVDHFPGEDCTYLFPKDSTTSPLPSTTAARTDENQQESEPTETTNLLSRSEGSQGGNSKPTGFEYNFE